MILPVVRLCSCFHQRVPKRHLVSLCLLLLFAWIGCGDTGQPIVVNVSPLPASAVQLKVMASLGQRIATESYSFSIPQVQGKQEFTFSFHAPTDGGSQNLNISVVALDGNGCSVSVGENRPTSAIDSLAGMDVRLSPIDKPDCNDSSLRSLIVRPGQVSTENGNPAGKPATVQVLGWGFRPGITAAFGGVPATAVRWKSVSALEADLPTLKGTPYPLGPLSLSLSNPDGSSDSRDDLLRRGFYANFGLQRVTPNGLSRSPDALADLDQDGRLDLLYVDAPSKSVLIFLARPDGSFSSSATWNVSFMQTPQSIAAVDVDGDAKPDLIVGLVVPSIPPSQTPTVGVVRNVGNGLFASMYASYLVGAAPSEISGIDVNHDGKTDLVVNTRADAVSILLNQGDGSFPFVAQSYAAGGAVQSIQAADLNEDGLPDLILNARTGSDPGGSVKVFTGLPTGEFKGIPESPFSGAAADSVRSLDLNRDGRQDLLAIFADSAAVLINQGRGQFAKIPTVYSFGTGFSAGVYTDTFDTNDDGFPDLVFDQGDGQIGVLLNATDGSFSSLRISSPITIAQRMVSADWNGDGRSDMLSVSSLGSLDFLINQGNGSFAVFPNKLGSLSADARLIPVDFDSDKKIDLIAYSGGQTLSFRNVSQ